MIDQETQEKLAHLRPLKADVLHRLKTDTVEAVYKEMGPRPRASDYVSRERLREWRSYVTPVDIAMLVVFIFIMIISATHQAVFSSILSLSVYFDVPTEMSAQATGGMDLSFLPQRLWFIVSHVIGIFFMAETGVIAFAVRNYIRVQDLVTQYKLQGVDIDLTWRQKWLHPDMLAALLFALIAIIANVYSMVSHLDASDPQEVFFIVFAGALGIIIPLITIYLGDHFGRLIGNIEVIRRRLQAEYRTDAAEWDRLHADPESHDSYTGGLRARIGEWYRAYAPRTKDFPQDFEWNSYILMVVAAREVARLRDNDDSFEGLVDFFGSPGVVSERASQRPSAPQSAKPLQRTADSPLVQSRSSQPLRAQPNPEEQRPKLSNSGSDQTAQG